MTSRKQKVPRSGKSQRGKARRAPRLTMRLFGWASCLYEYIVGLGTRAFGAIGSFLSAIWAGAKAIWTLLQHEVLDPLCCYGCVCVGVWLWLNVPIGVWEGLIPTSAIPQLPDAITVAGSQPANVLLFSCALGLGVFQRAYPNWRQSHDPLLARMLYAGNEGMLWLRPWVQIAAGWATSRLRPTAR